MRMLAQILLVHTIFGLFWASAPLFADLKTARPQLCDEIARCAGVFVLMGKQGLFETLGPQERIEALPFRFGEGVEVLRPDQTDIRTVHVGSGLLGDLCRLYAPVIP